MTKEFNHSQSEEFQMELEAYKKTAPEIARMILINQALISYLHDIGNRMLRLSLSLSHLFKLKNVREDEKATELAHEITNEFEDLRESTRFLYSWFKNLRITDARPLSECMREVKYMFRTNLGLEIDEVSGQMLVPDAIIQASVTNLVQNSLDALGAIGGNGRIRIKTEKTKGCIKLTVEDDGPGILPEILPMIGRPFFTTRPNRKGLGLHLVRLMLQKVGGKISIRNRDPHGTEVILTVPLNWREFLNEENSMD